MTASTISNVDSIVGKNVKLFLIAKGQTQTALGENLGMSRSAISKKLHGKLSWTASEVAGASHFLNVPIGLLFSDSFTYIQ